MYYYGKNCKSSLTLLNTPYIILVLLVALYLFMFHFIISLVI